MARISYFGRAAGVIPKGLSRLAPARSYFAQWESPVRTDAAPAPRLPAVPQSNSIHSDLPGDRRVTETEIGSVLKHAAPAKRPAMDRSNAQPQRAAGIAAARMIAAAAPLEECRMPEPVDSIAPAPERRTSVNHTHRNAETAGAVIETAPPSERFRSEPDVIGRERVVERVTGPAASVGRAVAAASMNREAVRVSSNESPRSVAVEIGSIDIRVAPPPPPPPAPQAAVIIAPPRPPRSRLARGFISTAGLSQE
jgi:hypothetical protein